ncbi:MAG: hypothetical protein IPF66_08850 [Holophagales bacterium]|nr:hypothetical protein [Holophagales bacterium]
MKRTLVALSAAFALIATAASAAPGPGNTAPRKGPSCCAEAETAEPKCDPVSKSAVTLTGTVLCEHCDLHVARSCNPVFKADGREGYLPFCPGTRDVDAVKSAAGNGKVKLEVKGTVCKMKDGKELLVVASFAKKG